VIEALKALLKQPYWVIALLLGGIFIAFPCVTVEKDYRWTAHPPATVIPIVFGAVVSLVSFAGFAYTLLAKRSADANGFGGLDLRRVKESGGVFSTTVNGCDIRVVNGRIEECPIETGVVVVLPCNEYFDDKCVSDTASALGAYVNRVFEGQVETFVSLVKEECLKRLGPGNEQQKTEDERAWSFGIGKCLMMTKPLGRSLSVALVSTTTQTAGEGLSARISYLFVGMLELFRHLADARLNRVVMPILGSGHGHIDPPLAFVGLLLAVAEAARYGQGGQRLKEVTIVVFRRDSDSPGQVDKTVVRRALALIGSQD